MTFLEAVLPSAGVLLFFVIVLRALLHADRRERAAAARYDSEHRAETGSATPHEGTPGRSDDESPAR